MNKKKDGAKITLGMLKGKSVTTSVPSIAIKFHANAELVEEFYASDDEALDKSDKLPSTASISSAGESESSPLKYFPKLIKRSTSVDVSSALLDSSPPSDPWKFFSDIRGKIEGKFTEIKQRNQEDSSPSKSKPIKDSKESSSLSDSEDLSESSISRTCGIASTTEGVEMSTDDETPSISTDKDKKVKEDKKAPEEKAPEPSTSKPKSSKSILRHRFRLLKNKKTPIRDGVLSSSSLSKLYNISTDHVEQALPEDDDIESGVDALNEASFSQGPFNSVLGKLSEKYTNISADEESVMNVEELDGKEIPFRQVEQPITVFAPTGFIDLRQSDIEDRVRGRTLLYILLGIILFYLMFKISSFLTGVITGVIIYWAYSLLNTRFISRSSLTELPRGGSTAPSVHEKIFKVPAIDEFTPVIKYEGWMNEYPEKYDPTTYHISNTQSVFLRLQGNLLRISHTSNKVPKRAMWNEPKIKPQLTHHRVYNLLGAKICLLPEGLNKKRHWSKKYPICVTLSPDQLDFNQEDVQKLGEDDDEEEEEIEIESSSKKDKKKGKKKDTEILYSKLHEAEALAEVESPMSRPPTPSPVAEQHNVTEMSDDTKDTDKETEDNDSMDDWSLFTPDASAQTKIYLFGRCDRQKEDWYRKLAAATHRGANTIWSQDFNNKMSQMLLKTVKDENEFYNYMILFNKVVESTDSKQKLKQPNQHSKGSDSKAKAEDGKSSENKPKVEDHKSSDTKAKVEDSKNSEEVPKQFSSGDALWINAMVGRILYDCMRDPKFTNRVKERLERKLAAIKLPYFIAQLKLTELDLGKIPPLFKNIRTPVLDERGLWVDVDVTYEGLIVCTLQTQLNLMKLKMSQQEREKPRILNTAMFSSDIDDSAESSSDEDNGFNPPPVLDNTGIPVTLGGSSNTSKKFIKMVDKIADSRIFQAATENRYIKRAMEGVSNTDLRLTVSFQSLNGTLVLNIPVPPSDRIWFGFRPVPQLTLTAKPVVGQRNITFLKITSWIEQQMIQEFMKIIVIPNMEDMVVPVMCPDLPQ